MRKNNILDKVEDLLYDIWDLLLKEVIIFCIPIVVILLFLCTLERFIKDNDTFMFITFLFFVITPIILFIAYKRSKQKWLNTVLWGGGIAVAFLTPILLFAWMMAGQPNINPININVDNVDYHNAEDLKKVTGVEFPKVVLVDSLYHDEWNGSYTEAKFIAPNGLKKNFYRRLDKACKTDSECWRKSKGDKYEQKGYYYYILPAKEPLDRTKGDGWRMVKDDNGKLIKDWDGDYISVFVPIDGDTITVEDGWAR